MMRTHTCGELRKKHEGQTVALCGWVEKVRLHGNINFIDIRDRYGITQAIADSSLSDVLQKVKREDVIKIKGLVNVKPQPNKNLETGEVEIKATEIDVLSHCDVLPINLDKDAQNTEETRLKYRYLDLRKTEMKNNIIFRNECAFAVREHLISEGFLELETPTLIRATPEGARDFIVPSRVNKGKFYALPQSPQIYKQLSMVSGFDKYFQLARCYRDEDLRADRQPEFTQIDVEMSFVEEEDVYGAGERLIGSVVKKVLGQKIKFPLPRFTHKEAMDRYGIDKPDIRFNLELKDVTSIVKKSDFKVFNEAFLVKCLVVEKVFTRKEIDKLTNMAKVYKAKGLAYLKFENGSLDGPIAKFLSQDVLNGLKDELKITEGSTVLFVADTFSVVNASLAAIRNHLGKELKLYDPNELAFCWVTDFPMFEWDDDEQKYIAAHHMFTMPKKECIEFLENDKGKVYAACYDMVLNGVELGSGSIRIHDKDLQKRVMLSMEITEEEALRKFGFLLEAFRYGVPPHGGFALGFDRLVALLKGEADIREFILFPKNKNMENPMDGAPSDIDKEQLDESNIMLKK